MAFTTAKISKNLTSSYWTQKTHLYELICHPHIEEDQTKLVYFMREKNQFDQEKID